MSGCTASHPLRQVRRLADQALDRLNPTFCKLYPEVGRPSIPSEQLLLSLLLQAIYGIRSERMLIEQLEELVLQLLAEPERLLAILVAPPPYWELKDLL